MKGRGPDKKQPWRETRTLEPQFYPVYMEGE